ncbi:MAG: diguanylate cyclase [Tepidiformaceae bacterium]
MLVKNIPTLERQRVLRVLVVDPSVDDCRRVRSLLQATGEFLTHIARDADDAVHQLSTGSFDVALIEYSLWSAPSAQIVTALREQRSDVAVVLLTSGENEREALPALKLGAHDFLSKQNLQDSGQLAARILSAVAESHALRRRDTMVRWLEREARTDHLTGLYNRRAFDDQLRDACAASLLSGDPVTLLVIDVTGTRTVNEVHGHDTGDDMIRRAASAITRSIRGGDFAARVGGDDFGIVLADGDLELGRFIARRIAHEVERLNDHEWASLIPVDLTFGVASGRNCAPGELFSAADKQLSDYKSAAPAITWLRTRDDTDGPFVA